MTHTLECERCKRDCEEENSSKQDFDSWLECGLCNECSEIEFKKERGELNAHARKIGLCG